MEEAKSHASGQWQLDRSLREFQGMGRDIVSLHRGGLGVDLLRFRQLLGVS